DADERIGDDLAMKYEAGFCEHRFVRERITAVDVPAIECVDVRHAGGPELTQQVRGQESFVLAIVARVQRAHDLIEIVRVVRGIANRNVEQESEQRALRIVKLRTVE